MISRAELLAAVATIKAYRDQDPVGTGATVPKLLIAQGVIFPSDFAPPEPEKPPGLRPLPDDLSTLTAVQVSIHDNWRQETKPYRPGKNGKRARGTPTRYAVTIHAWDAPEDDIDISAKAWGYHLVGDLFDAEGFRQKALDLMNMVFRDGAYVIDKNRRNAVKYPISEDCAEAMIEMSGAFPDPDYRFACLAIKGKTTGTAIAPFQILRMKLASGRFGPVVTDAVLTTGSSQLPLPVFLFQQSDKSSFSQASNVVAQARFANDNTTKLDWWKTKSAKC